MLSLSLKRLVVGGGGLKKIKDLDPRPLRQGLSMLEVYNIIFWQYKKSYKQEKLDSLKQF